jgi:small-conductance mechanosensitive channel
MQVSRNNRRMFGVHLFFLLLLLVMELMTSQTLSAVEPESALYSDQAMEREKVYAAKEEILRAKIQTTVDEKETQSLQLQLQLLTKLRELPWRPGKPAVDLEFSDLDLHNTVSWREAEKYLERYVNIMRESKLSARNIKNTNKQIQELYDKLLALDGVDPQQDVLQLQYAYQMRKLANQKQIDEQLQQGLDEAKEKFPQILARAYSGQEAINRQLDIVGRERGTLQHQEDTLHLAMTSDEALIQQQESLLAGYLGGNLAPDESRVMHYEQLKLLNYQVTKLNRESQLLAQRLVLYENIEKALWLQLLGVDPNYFKISNGLGDLVEELESLQGITKKIHYQVYAREKELSTLRGGNAVVGPKAQELIGSLDEIVRESLTKLANFDQRIGILVDKSSIMKRIIEQRQSPLGSMVIKTREVTNDFLQKVLAVLRFPLVSYNGMSISLLLVLEIIALLVCSIIVSRLYGLLVLRTGRKRKWSERTVHLVQAVGKYPFILAVAMVILSVVGINTSSLALVAGALSVGIGFGMQAIVNNLVSGIILLFDKSIRPGDYISFGSNMLNSSFRGSVVQMNIRATVLRTNDNISIIIPNGDLLASQVVNWTYADETICYRVPFSVAYGTDIDLVKAVIGKAMIDLPVVLGSPEPQIWLAKHAESSLDFLAAIWVEGEHARLPARTFDLVLTAIYKTLRAHGIEIPFPQLNLHLPKKTAEQPAFHDFRHFPN